ncbi:MAG: pilus assembly protein PilP [Deltaproteobacteria bacterium]|nr:pilus assembly protein PilP [Deltaproteobacteria bacterium]
MAALLVLVFSAGCSDEPPAPTPEAPKGPTAVRIKIKMAPFPGEGVPMLASGATAPAIPMEATPVAVAALPTALTPATAVAAAGGATPLVAGAEGMGLSPSTAFAEAGSFSPGMRIGGGAGLSGLADADLELAYSYNPAGKVDPFKPFVRETADGTKVSEGAGAEELPPLPPGSPPPILPDYDWRQLKLVAVVTKSTGGAPVAMVEDPTTKKGYSITKGVRLGRTNALVTEISLDSVIVEEMVKDYVTGEWQSRPQTISVKKTAGD